MTEPARLIPTFAPAPSPTTAPASTPAASTARSAADLEQKLSRLSAEQLATVERYVDALDAGGEPPVEAPPLEVVATRWWWRVDSTATTRPIAIQRVRGLDLNVVQLPEHASGLDASLVSVGGALASVLRADPNTLGRWFGAGGKVGRVGAVPSSLERAPFPSAPWDGYAPHRAPIDHDEAREARAGRKRT
jgi:hypothetical protein